MFSDIKSILISLIVLLIVFGLLVLILKSPIFRKILLGVFCVLIIFTGIITAYADIEYFSAHGGIYGTIKDVFIKNEVIQNDLTFKFSNFSLVESNQNNTYQAEFYNIKNVNITMKDKMMEVNDCSTELIIRGENYIISDYTYVFYDESLNELAKDTLTIKFVFNNKGDVDTSYCVISSNCSNRVVKYWNQFLKNNDLIVNLKIQDFFENKTISKEQPIDYKINLYIDENTLYETYTLNCLSKLTNLPEIVNDKPVLTWKDSEGNIYTDFVLQNINLYAEFPSGPYFKLIITSVEPIEVSGATTIGGPFTAIGELLGPDFSFGFVVDESKDVVFDGSNFTAHGTCNLRLTIVGDNRAYRCFINNVERTEYTFDFDEEDYVLGLYIDIIYK